MSQELSIHTIQTERLITFRQGENFIIKATEPKIRTEIPYRQILWAAYDEDSQVLQISYLSEKKKNHGLSLSRVEGKLRGTGEGVAKEWVDALMHMAYEGSNINRNRRLKVLVNPHGGVGKGVPLFVKTVEPIFRAARCSLDITHTTHNGHAHDISKSLPLREFDVVVTVSGDGLVHEVMNGFANHVEPKEAFAMPICPIPTGSGNGLSLNLLGIEKGFDVVEAALNVVKGKKMKVDVFSLTQNGKRTISFMSQALGLMADLDIGTEHLRWMGDARFMVGLLKGVLQFKPCPVQLSVKVAEEDKAKMAAALNSHHTYSRTEDAMLAPGFVANRENSGGLPPLKYSLEDSDGWTTFPEPILYIYAGKGPYVGRDFMAFPVSLPNDGLIDVTAMPVSSRKDILSALGGAEKGENYWNPKLYYVKAHAYKVKPLAPRGCLAVDGEHLPFDEFQVEVHQGLATFLSSLGSYAADFSPKTQKTVA